MHLLVATMVEKDNAIRAAGLTIMVFNISLYINNLVVYIFSWL